MLGCLPLPMEHIPSQHDLHTAFEYFSYDIVVDPPLMSGSFCIKVPGDWKSQPLQEAKDIFELAVMKSQMAFRLAQSSTLSYSHAGVGILRLMKIGIFPDVHSHLRLMKK